MKCITEVDTLGRTLTELMMWKMSHPPKFLPTVIYIFYQFHFSHVPRSIALLPRVPVAGRFHSGSNSGVSDNRTLLQCGSALGRDEHQCGLVPSCTRLCHVSLHQFLFTSWLFFFSSSECQIHQAAMCLKKGIYGTFVVHEWAGDKPAFMESLKLKLFSLYLLHTLYVYIFSS